MDTIEVRFEPPTESIAHATLRIVRPEAGNALSRVGAEQLSDAVDRMAADPPPGVIVAAEGERFFCAGGDLVDYRELTDRESALAVSHRMRDILGRLRALPALVVCAIEGAAIGGGTELALACDLRIAGLKATIAMPQSRLGVVLGWGSEPLLVEAVGRGRAVELLMTGRAVGAQEAEALGLVHTVVAAGQAEAAARALIDQVATASPSAVRAVKKVLDPAASPAEVAAIFADLWVGDDHRAAEAAWRDRQR
ncbi:MAG: enoyl-CoA hydratase/isomerase family protein [Actinomycetota bacterium]